MVSGDGWFGGWSGVLSIIGAGRVCVLGSSYGLGMDRFGRWSGVCRLQGPIGGDGGQACLQESYLLSCTGAAINK